MRILTKQAKELISNNLAIITGFNIEDGHVYIREVATGHSLWCYMDEILLQTYNLYNDRDI